MALPPSWKSEVQKSVQEKIDADGEQRKAENDDAAATISAALKTIGDAQDRQTSHQDSGNQRNLALNVVTIALVFLTVIFTYKSWRAFEAQLIEMQKVYGPIKESADAAKDSAAAMQLDERPWVSLDVSLGGPLVHGATGSSNDVTWHVLLVYRLKNLGKTPAIDVAFFAHILPMVGGKEGIVFSQELDKACDFTEKMLTVGLGWGEMIFPQEEWPEKSFLVSGDEEIFQRAKTADPEKNQTRNFGQFLVAPCVTYKSSFASGAPFRTAKQYFITKKNGAPINLDGETLNPADVYFTPNRTHGSSVK